MIENFGTVMLSISAISATLLTLVIAVTAILNKKEDFFELKLIIKHDLSWAVILTIFLPLVLSLSSNFQIFLENVIFQYVSCVMVLIIFAYVMLRQFYKMYYAALSEEKSYGFSHNNDHIKPPTDISNMTLMTQPFEVRAFKNKLYPKMRKAYYKNHGRESEINELFRNEFDIEMDSILDRWLKGDESGKDAKSFRDYSKLPDVLEPRFENKLSPRIQAPDQVVMICLSWLHQTNKDDKEKTILKSLILLDEYICYMLRKKRTVLKQILKFNYYCKSNANVYMLYSDLLHILAKINSNSLNKDELKKLAEFGQKSYCHITEAYAS